MCIPERPFYWNCTALKSTADWATDAFVIELQSQKLHSVVKLHSLLGPSLLKLHRPVRPSSLHVHCPKGSYVQPYVEP